MISDTQTLIEYHTEHVRRQANSLIIYKSVANTVLAWINDNPGWHSAEAVLSAAYPVYDADADWCIRRILVSNCDSWHRMDPDNYRRFIDEPRLYAKRGTSAVGLGYGKLYTPEDGWVACVITPEIKQ